MAIKMPGALNQPGDGKFLFPPQCSWMDMDLKKQEDTNAKKKKKKKKKKKMNMNGIRLHKDDVRGGANRVGCRCKKRVGR